MEKLYFIFLFIFAQINSQIKENPIFLIEDKNPFVLSTIDYYYVMTEQTYLKIKIDSGNIEKTINNTFDQKIIFIMWIILIKIILSIQIIFLKLNLI